MTENEEITVKGFGLEGKASGRKLLSANGLLLVFACALAVFGYQLLTTTREEHRSQSEAMQKLFEAMSENNYILSLSQADRERLNIQMPDSLRRKINRQ